MFPLSAFRQDMDRLFDRFLGGWGEPGGLLGDPLRLDVSETDEEIRVRAEVPGIDPEDIDIQLSGDLLTLSGEKKSEAEENGTCHYSERCYGSFRRTLRLGTPVEPDRIHAEHRNGVVTIRLAKAESPAAAHPHPVPLIAAEREPGAPLRLADHDKALERKRSAGEHLVLTTCLALAVIAPLLLVTILAIVLAVT
jgi:HSP20 family protein